MIFPTELFSSGRYGEQQGGGSCRGGDGRQRRRGGQVMRRVRRSDRRPLPALLHGALLAHALPQVLVLPRAAGRVQQHLLQQGRHDPLQERLHQVRPSDHPAAVCTRWFSPIGFKDGKLEQTVETLILFSKIKARHPWETFIFIKVYFSHNWREI